jgi:hypothetical protein
MPKPSALAFLLFLIAALAIGPLAQNPSQQNLSDLLPNPLPSQTVIQSEAVFYNPETLYKYMDGGADAFLLYDFRMLLHEDLRVKGTDLSVDIFDMSTPENAFGMYASERSPSYHYVSIGAEGYDNEGILNFFQGPYYVKLAAFGSGASAVLEQFATTISSKIKAEPSLPAALNLLPSTNRKPHSEQFLLKDPLGHSFLGPAYLARYNLSHQESTLLLSIASDPAQAQERLKLLTEHFKSTGQCEPALEFGDGAIRANNSFEGKAIAGTKGRYLILLINPVSGAETIFEDTLQRLR